MLSSNKQGNQPDFIDKRIYSTTDSENKSKYGITSYEYKDANYVLKIIEHVYRISISHRLDDHYYIDKDDVTSSLIKFFDEKLKEMKKNYDYYELFYSHKYESIVIVGNNNKNFISDNNGTSITKNGGVKFSV